jgi:hypothetical protein
MLGFLFLRQLFGLPLKKNRRFEGLTEIEYMSRMTPSRRSSCADIVPPNELTALVRPTTRPLDLMGARWGMVFAES